MPATAMAVIKKSITMLFMKLLVKLEVILSFFCSGFSKKLHQNVQLFL